MNIARIQCDHAVTLRNSKRYRRYKTCEDATAATLRVRSRIHNARPQPNTTTCVPINSAKPAKKPDADAATAPAVPAADDPCDTALITPPINAGMQPATRLPAPLVTPKALAVCSGREQYWIVLGIAGLCRPQKSWPPRGNRPRHTGRAH